MPENNDKFADIREILSFYSASMNKIITQQSENYRKLKLDAEQEAADAERQRQVDIVRTISSLQAQNAIKTGEEATAYAKKLDEEHQQRRLESEIFILKEVSKREEDRRAKQTEILKKEKALQEKKNAGDNKKVKLIQKDLDNLKKEEALIKKKERKKAETDRLKEDGLDYEFGDTFKQIFDPLIKEIATGNALKRSADQAIYNSLKSMGKAIDAGVNAINQTISEYAKYQTAINTRLQGTNGDAVNIFGNLVNKLDEVAFSPLISASALYSNLNQLIGQGIVTNVEQRAFFETIKDGIATTFDVTSESLNRMIRIQHNDSTAARLGMEGYLTRFLNTYVENTEYLQSTFDNVASSLLEASAVLGSLRGVNKSLEFEYVVQKWLGTLTGIGLSNETAQSIANALGQLGSGNVDVLNTQMGTLLTMSASTIGANIGNILSEGLDAETTNSLLASMVKYLQSIADNGTNVTKAELAKIFGVSISDLVAVAQLDQAAIQTINEDLLSYGGMYTELRSQFSKLPSRMGISNILENLFSNLTYQTGMNIAGNPASYAMWKITDLIQGVTGGINIPFITALGSGVDLNATVEQLMKLGMIGVNMLGNIGNIVNAAGSIGKGEILLDKLGISQGTGNVKKFGGGLTLTTGGFRNSGKDTSQLLYIGQEDSDAYYQSTLNKQRSDANKELRAITNTEQVDPLLEYLRKEVSLKDNIMALKAATVGSYEILDKLAQPATSNTQAAIVTPQINTQNTSTNTSTISTATTVSEPSLISDYFKTIGFAEGFASIVKNLGEINEKIAAGNNTTSSGSIVGLTQNGVGY